MRNRGGKSEVLAQLDFSTGTAEYQQSFYDDYVQTRVTSQAVDPRYPLVIGRKGTGKTAIFRWLLGGDVEARPIPVFCPNAFRDQIKWALTANGFARIESIFGSLVGWPTFWACYTALASFLAPPDQERVDPPDRFNLDLSEFRGSYDELSVVDCPFTDDRES